MTVFSSRLWIILMLWLPAVNLQMPMMPFMPSMAAPVMPPMFYPPPPPPPPSPPIAFQIMQLQDPKAKDGRPGKEEKTVGIAIPMSFPAPMQFNLPAPAALPGAPFPPASPQSPFSPMLPGLPYHHRPPGPYYPGSPIRPPPGGPYGSPFEEPYGPPLTSFTAYCKQKPKPADCSRGKRYRARDLEMPRQRLWREKSHENVDISSSSEWINENTRRRASRGVKRATFPIKVDSYNEDFAKPVLSYISNNGEIKMEKPLSDDEAVELMEDQDEMHRVEVTAQGDEDQKQSVKVVSSMDVNTVNDGVDLTRRSDKHRRKQVMLKSGSVQHVLGQGKKELVFKPPNDKKISNLSVSFQII